MNMKKLIKERTEILIRNLLMTLVMLIALAIMFVLAILIPIGLSKLLPEIDYNLALLLYAAYIITIASLIGIRMDDGWCE